MHRVDISMLQPGMKLGRSIYNSRADELLVAGVVLTDDYIEKLRELGIAFVWVDDGLLSEIQEKEAVSVETRVAAMRQVRSIILEAQATGKLLVHPEEVYSTVGELAAQLLGNQNVLFNLVNLHSYDDYLFSHSVNVCILSIMTGITLGYDSTLLADLGVGALLHDLGKIKLPDKILNKPGRLSNHEYAQVKLHTAYGYELIKEARDLGKTPALIALRHHENVNGSGYPFGVSGDRIPEFAQVVAIADRFDAISSNRIYREAFSPREAFEMCAASGNVYFNYDIVKAFLKNIAVYPRGTLVELNNGAVALVLDTPKGYPLFPRVRLLSNSPAIGERSNEEINLQDRADLYIVRTLNGDEKVVAGLFNNSGI